MTYRLACVLALALLLSGCPGSNGTSPTAGASPGASAPSPSRSMAKLGEIAKVGNLAIAVVGWRELEPSDLVKPADDARFIALDLVLVNQGKQPGGLMGAKVRVGARTCEVDMMATALAKGSPAAIVEPGERVRTTVAFEVPKAESALALVLEGAEVDLGTKPAQVDAPGTLPGEVARAVHEAGKPVAAEGIEVTVHGAALLEASDQELAKPDPGMAFLAVDLTFENKRAALAELDLLMGAHVLEASGAVHDSDMIFGRVLLKEEGLEPSLKLAPAEPRRGKIAFQVPRGAKELTFRLQTSFPLGPRIDVRLPDAAAPAPQAPLSPEVVELERSVDGKLDEIASLARDQKIDDLVPAFRSLTSLMEEHEKKSGDAGKKTRARWNKRLEEWKEIRLAVLYESYKADGNALVVEIAKTSAEHPTDAAVALEKLETLVERIRREDRDEFQKLADELTARGEAAGKGSR